jgi:GT2 family glycosyltransferase
LAQNDFPLVSVIILSWNAKDYLKKCLDSVIETDYPFLEVIVSDNGSSDGSVEMVKKKYPNVILIENKTNMGFSEGNNVAIKRAKGDIIVLLNQDTWVDKNWIKEIVKVARDPKIGVVGCKLYYPNTKIIQSVGFYLHPSGYHIPRGAFQVDVGQFDKIVDVDYVMGAALAIKRRVVDKIGLLDPMFYAYYEDVDWCYRVKKAGYRVVIAPKAVVYHFGSVSWGKNSFRQIYLNKINKLKFVMKHYYGLKLLKSLTFYDLKFKIDKVREFLMGKLFIQKDRQSLSSTNNLDYLKTLIKYILNWLGAELLSYLLILPMTKIILTKKTQSNRDYPEAHRITS